MTIHHILRFPLLMRLPTPYGASYEASTQARFLPLSMAV